MDESSIVEQFGANSGLILEKFELYKRDPGLVDEYWQKFFGKGSSAPVAAANSGLTVDKVATAVKPSNGNHAHSREIYQASAIRSAVAEKLPEPSIQKPVSTITEQQPLVQLFERFGHYYADTNPLSSINIPQRSSISTELEDLLQSGENQDEIAALRDTFCSTIGFEYSHLVNASERKWFQSKIAGWKTKKAEVSYPDAQARLRQLIEGEVFENELHKKFIGAKRFSLEGGETMLPMLHTLVEKCAELGAEEMFFGMAHRGRLSVLCNLIGKPLSKLFCEFEDKCDYGEIGSGDVKYHGGYRKEYETKSSGKIKLSLAYNPSHLEFVNPVVIGSARAAQDDRYGRNRSSAIPVLMHGDAAFIGQGVVSETFNMSQVPAYFAGGTIHIVTNNQMGFTTGIKDARSTVYCTDPYKGFDIPIFHVNCEDIDAACWLMELAAEYREEFHKDIIIDLICWRKYGHNEGDDPTFTQPVEYAEIKAKKLLSEQYIESLIKRNLAELQNLEIQRESYKLQFNQEQQNVTPFDINSYQAERQVKETPVTTVTEETLRYVADTIVAFPSDFTPHPKIKQMLEKRSQSLSVEKGIDWGLGETLAFGSLVYEGKHIRLTGQDAERATFSHRHLVLKDSKVQGKTFSPMSLLEENDGLFEVYNSTLSETAVMGYEYGYSIESKDDLVLWEAQFGDFANGAQVIIDQFLASSEVKWKQTCGLVLLLPHGYEGQGPEHSSARLERFLQLCAEGNMRVCYPSNGAQYFHILREQGLAKVKRPLVIMTPKSLLRLHEAGSSLSDLTKTGFKTIIETSFGKPKSALICSGKIYYDLLAAINAKGVKDVKLIRVEQLYPFPSEELHDAIQSISRGNISWVQEEPRNMGAWNFVEPYIRAIVGHTPQYIGRPEAATTADGSAKYHAKVQKEIVEEAIKS